MAHVYTSQLFHLSKLEASKGQFGLFLTVQPLPSNFLKLANIK